MPKVSVIITCYNYGRFLPEAVESAVSQTYGDLEIIVVDDGSTDGSKEIAESLAEKYPDKVRVLIQPNQGVSAARNNGIRMARGEYIVPLDADDMLAADFVKETARLLDEHPDVDIAYTKFRMFGGADNAGVDGMGACEYDFRRLVRKNIIPNTSLFRKSAWESSGGYKDMHYEDWEFWINLGKAGHFGKMIDRPLFLYRAHGPSRSLEYEARFRRYFLRVKLLHPDIYAPAISRLNVPLAKAFLAAHSFVRDVPAHFLYRNLPGLHAFLKSLATRGGIW